jgi:signal transduction histidine kinase
VTAHPRLLVVDDNAADRMLIRRALVAEFGTPDITEAGDQRALDEAIASGPYDVVITDYRLRWNDGLWVLAAVHAATPDVPVIMFTNTGNEEVAAAGLRGGLADYIVKAAGHYARLAHAVRRVMEHAHSKRRERELLAREQDARRSAEAANRLKDEFLATVSHELRTPLNAIAGWLQIMKAKPGDAMAARRGIDVMERNSRLLLRIVEDLLDMSRIIAGKLTMTVKPTDVCEVIETVVVALQPASAARRIEVTTTCREPVPPVMADRDRLQQIIWNLLSNAVKFTPELGRVDIITEHAASIVRLTVRDTGKGITSEFLPHIFDRFTQQDSGSTRAHTGMGLGLAVVRHLVELHGGTIAAHSDGPDRGAAFVVEFPVAAALQGANQTAARRGRKPLIGRRVLAVDNDPDSRDLIAAILMDHGAEVTAVASASDAMEMLRSAPFAVLVSDIAMPAQDGYDLLRQIRADPHDAIARIPAIALTAYGRDEDRLKALDAGYQLHLAKPVSALELVGAVESLAAAAPDGDATSDRSREAARTDEPRTEQPRTSSPE